MRSSIALCEIDAQKITTIRQVNFAVTIAWSEFSFGPQSLSLLDSVYGIKVGETLSQHRRVKEAKRLENCGLFVKRKGV